ncbi:hypothetical protein D3C87_1770250 [compost metagenome]
MAVDAVVGADVEQVIQAQRAVHRHRDTGLVAPRGLGAAVVQAQRDAPFLGLRVLDDEIAVAGLCIGRGGGLNLDVGFCGRSALEVFEALLDVAQVQQIAGACWDG